MEESDERLTMNIVSHCCPRFPVFNIRALAHAS